MSDETTEPGNTDHAISPQDDTKWPRYCEYCGGALASVVVDELMNSDTEHLQTGSPATVVAQDVCENEKCPAKAGQVMPAYDAFTGDALGEAQAARGPIGVVRRNAHPGEDTTQGGTVSGL
jgi:hypothetical protein